MDRWSARVAPQLAALVALAEHGAHMTRAAQAMDIPQSSMSRRIHALEELLCVPLVIRDGRTIRLTHAAQELVRQAREPLRRLNQVCDEIATHADPDHGTVRFGFPLTMGSGQIPDLLANFRLRYPGIRVILEQAHGDRLTDDLLDGSLDLAVIIPPPARLSHTVLGTQHILALLPHDHPLADAPAVDLADLAGDRFIANPASYNLRRLTENWCREAGFEPDITVEVTEFTTIRELVCRGLGIALLPHDDQTPDGAVERTLVGGHYRRDIALAHASSVPSPVTRRLAEHLQRLFE